MIKRPIGQLAVELVAPVAVGKDGHREAPRRNHEEGRFLAVDRPAMLDDADPGDVLEEPGDADGVGQPSPRLRHRTLHARQRCSFQEPRPIRSGTVAQVEARVLELVDDVRGDAAGRVGGPRQAPGSGDLEPVPAPDVPQRVLARHDIFGEEEAVVHAQRVEDRFLDHALKRLARCRDGGDGKRNYP